MSLIYNVLLGGSMSNLPYNWQAFDGTWVGIDRGAWKLIDENVDAEMAIGDFDSLSQSEFDDLNKHFKNIIKLDPIKDDTDTEYGLSVILKKHPDARIRVIGMSGGRLDHFISNMFLILQERFRKFAKQIEFIDMQNHISFFDGGKYMIEKKEGFKYLSFIALTPIESLTLSDEKYKLDHKNISYPRAYVSNEFVGNCASFEFSDGILAVIQSRD